MFPTIVDLEGSTVSDPFPVLVDFIVTINCTASGKRSCDLVITYEALAVVPLLVFLISVKRLPSLPGNVFGGATLTIEAFSLATKVTSIPDILRLPSAGFIITDTCVSVFTENVAISGTMFILTFG